MKYHLQTRLESINPTQKPKNGILLSKEPLRRHPWHPWHGNDWEGRNCWTWWKLMWRKTWCDDSWPWTAFHCFSWVVEEILVEFSYWWNLRSATQRSQLRRDRETATLPPPPILWFVPKLSKQIKMNSGVVLRICCFPIFSLQTRLNNKF